MCMSKARASGCVCVGVGVGGINSLFFRLVCVSVYVRVPDSASECVDAI